MNNCEMCNILKEEKYRIILTTEHCFVCVIIEPLSNSHLMILPKRHTTTLNELTEKESKDFLETIEKTSDILHKVFKGRGAFTLVNHQELKTQNHLHFHMMAINAGVRSLIAPYLKVEERKRLQPEELEKIANYIKDKIKEI